MKIRNDYHMRHGMALITAVFAFAVPCRIDAAATVEKVYGIDNARIRRVVISKTDPGHMAVASYNTVYQSQDAGKSFRKILVVKDESVRHLWLDDAAPTPLYAACTRNGYRIIDDTAERIFTVDEGETIHFIQAHGGVLYAGTSQGLYYADPKLFKWQRDPALPNEDVYSMAAVGSSLFLSCGSGVYQHLRTGSTKRLFVTRTSGGEEQLVPYRVSGDAMLSSRLWLCTSKGVYVSNNRGETWERFYIFGTGNAAAYCLVQFPLDSRHFYLCSDAGFHKIDMETGSARPLLSGLPTSKVNWADISDSGELYLATDQGLYRQVPGESRVQSFRQNGLDSLMDGEPSIHEVQEAAMRYNAVHPSKTDHWRQRLKYRALLPRLGVDYDKTIGSSFTSSGYYYRSGPYDWGLSLTWDLDELIWNSYEDDVDNRTKLTTQLRLDILDEVNRLYFERLRLKHEITHASRLSDDLMLKELRMQELTATLNGYTGGLYSR